MAVLTWLRGLLGRLRLRLGIDKPCESCGAALSAEERRGGAGHCSSCVASVVLGTQLRRVIGRDVEEYERLWIKRCRYARKGQVPDESQIVRLVLRINKKVRRLVPSQAGMDVFNDILAAARERAEAAA